MAESRLWGNIKTNNKAVTIRDKNQTFYFKSFSDCAKFISEFSDCKVHKIQKLLTDKATFILGFKIFYETEK